MLAEAALIGSVGPPLTLTHCLQLSPVAATGYSRPAKCLLAVRPSRVALAGPMGCFDDSDQLARDYLTSRTHFQEISRRLCLRFAVYRVWEYAENPESHGQVAARGSSRLLYISRYWLAQH